MQNHIGTIDSQNQPQISQSDKLLFCAFLAAAFHGLLFFAVGFKVPDLSHNKYDKTFNVMLAQFETDKKPDKADFIGQANQEGGGDSEQKLAPTATEMAQFNDPNEVASELQQIKSSNPLIETTPEILISQGKSAVSLLPQEENIERQEIPDTASLLDRSYRLTGLIASLDNQNINQASKNRKRPVSASIHRASDALYLDNWRRKIERVGNINYPEKAKLEKIYGDLTMKVTINKDGTVHQIVITESSGSKVLDDAAIRIVRLASPFKPLTKEMSKDTDLLEIIRVWQFQPNDQLKTH